MATLSFDIGDEKALELCEIFKLRLNYQGDLSTAVKKKQFVQKAIQRDMLLLVQAYRRELAQQSITNDPEFVNSPLEEELKAQQPLAQ